MEPELSQGNMLKNLNKIKKSMVVAVASCTLVLTSCSSSPSRSSSSVIASTTTTVPGISKSIILIGTHQPITGADAVGQNEIAPATAAFFQFINQAGGVYGRKILYRIEDDGSNPIQASQVVRQLVLTDKVFAILDGSGTSDHSAVEAFLNAEHVPDIFVGSGCSCWNNVSQFPWTSGWQTDFVIEGKILGQYISQYIKLHPSQDKIGFIYEDNLFGKQELQGLDQEIPTSEIVSQQVLNASGTSVQQVQAAITAMKSSGAQVVALAGDPELTAQVMDEGYGAAYLPLWVVPYSSSAPSVLTPLLNTYASQFIPPAPPLPSDFAQNIESSIVSDTFLPLATNSSNPWISLFRKIHDSYIPNLDFNAQVIYGMSLGYSFYELLVGAGKNPTQQSLLKALQTQNLNGPNLAPYNYSSSSAQGMTGAQITVDQNGVLSTQGPVYVTNDSSGSINVYNGPPPTPPSNF